MAKMGFGADKQFRPKYGNQPVDAIVNGRPVHFKSKLEYRWAQHLDLLKTAGEIKDFFYEFHTFHFSGKEKRGKFTPDFLVRTNKNELEYHECKGLVQAGDISAFRQLSRERPRVRLILVFASRGKMSGQKRRSLEEYTDRIIWNANTIFNNEPIDMGD